MKTGTQINTKIEIGKEFFTVSNLKIESHICNAIRVTKYGTFDAVEVEDKTDSTYQANYCYRYIQDIRNALETAINKLGARDEH